METSNKSIESNPVFAVLPLWKSFWFGLFGAIIFGIVLKFALSYTRGAAALNMSENVSEIVGWVIFVPFYLLLMSSLWKSAYNTKTVFLGHLARAYAVLTSLLFVAILITALFD